MPRGGPRPGGGRPKGSKSKKTLEIALKAAAQGVTPIEVMLQTMRAAWSQAIDDSGSVVNQAKAAEAASLAKDAAPYVHPKLSSVEAKHDINWRDLSDDALDSRLAELERQIATATAAGGARGETTTH